MKCPKCGNDILSTDSHCSSCGVHLATAFKEKTANSKPQTTSGKVCPKCGHPIKSTDITCGYCTHYLGAPPKQPPTPSLPKSRIKDDIFYQIFLYLPFIFAILTVVACLALTIVFKIAWIFFVGIPASALIWFCLKVALSPVRLQIDYLDAIERNSRTK